MKKSFPRSSADEISASRKFAYGGSLIQDLGYYPGGNKFFSDLVHYVRSGDFVTALIEDSQTIDEYAFALGALSHYSSDNIGHATATNLSVPILYPELRRKYGNLVTYEDKPSAHLKVEFGYDVVQVARGKYASDDFQDFIGFDIAREVLKKSFQRAYGLSIEEIFPDFETAIGTYRYSVTGLIPDMIKVAWELKKDDIEKLGTTRDQFFFRMSRPDFEKAYGTKYTKSGFFSKLIAFFVRILPPIGPLKILKFKPPTPEVEAMFLESYETTLSNYTELLRQVAQGQDRLENKDLDTGEQTHPGRYRLTDKTYSKWIEILSRKNFATVDSGLRQNILTFYADLPRIQEPKPHSKDSRKLQEQLQQLNTQSAR